MTLMFLIGGFERSKFQNYVEKYVDQWNGVQGLSDLMCEAVKNRELNIPREKILFFGSVHHYPVNINGTRMSNFYGADVWDLTRAELEGRQQVKQFTSFFRKYVPGFEHVYLA
jgi:hypothetical protein